VYLNYSNNGEQRKTDTKLISTFSIPDVSFMANTFGGISENKAIYPKRSG
jgi:hypothetical protein